MKKAEKELLLYTACFRSIIDCLPFDIWFKDAAGNNSIVNKFLFEHSDNTIPHAPGIDSLHTFLNSADLPVEMCFSKETVRSEQTEQGIYEIHEIPVTDKSGKLMGTIGYSMDITHELLLSNFPGVAYRSKDDKDFTMTFISEGCYDLTGYSAEDLLNLNPSYYDLIHPDYREKLLTKWRNDIHASDTFSDEYPIVTASGDIKWVWEQFREKRKPDQKFIATEGFVTDITEKKLAEKALTESEERFRTIFERSPFGIGVFSSKNGIAKQVNKKFAEIVGRAEDELLSMDWRQYTHPDDIEENMRSLDLLLSDKISEFSLNKRYIRPDGSVVWINMIIVPFKTEDAADPRHLCMIEDITERKNAEIEILYLSYYDQLTGLFNRRYYEREAKRLDNSYNLPLSFVMADVNGLKLINDAFGHLEGDKLLKRVANIIRAQCRPDDVAARIGGDEFVLLLPKTTNSEAKEIVLRIHSNVTHEKINHINCSVSLGFATKEDSSQDINGIFMQAENQMYRYKFSESTSMRNETIKVITKALYEKSRQEQYHGERVSSMCETMGRSLNMSETEIRDLKTAGLLHDIGKIGIDKQLFNKDGNLTDSEWSDIRRHPDIGYQILRSVDEFAPIAEYVLHHHERIDGKGYPRGIKGDKTPLQSKIINIVNAYDKMTRYRSYKDKLSKSEAIEELKRNSGTQFDQGLVEVFIKRVLGE